jgi:hypothetical protein
VPHWYRIQENALENAVKNPSCEDRDAEFLSATGWERGEWALEVKREESILYLVVVVMVVVVVNMTGKSVPLNRCLSGNQVRTYGGCLGHR